MWTWTVNAGMPGRVESYFDNPNTFAEVLILLLPLVLALILCSSGPWPPAWRPAAPVRRGRARPGHDLLPGQLGGRGLRHGGAGVFVEAQAAPPVRRPVRADAIPFLPDYHLEPRPHHLQPGGLPPPPAASPCIRRRWRSSGPPPSPARAWAPPPSRTTSGTTTSITRRRPSSTPTTSISRCGSRPASWALRALSAPCCGTSSGRPTRSGTALPPPPAPSPAPAAAALCGAMVCGLADYLWNYPESHVHLLVRVRADGGGRQGLPRTGGDGLTGKEAILWQSWNSRTRSAFWMGIF